MLIVILHVVSICVGLFVTDILSYYICILLRHVHIKYLIISAAPNMYVLWHVLWCFIFRPYSVSCQLSTRANYRTVSIRGVSWINGGGLRKLNFSTAWRRLRAVIQLIPSHFSERGGTCLLVYIALQRGAIVKMAMSCTYAELCTKSYHLARRSKHSYVDSVHIALQSSVNLKLLDRCKSEFKIGR